jgi:hypothetical protein
MEIQKRAQEMPRSVIDGKRKSRWAAVRSTYRELNDSTVRTWKEWFPEEVFGVFKKNDMTHYIRYGDVELDVVFRALDKPDDVRKLLSVEYTGAWLNEARETPKVILDALEGRVGRYPRKVDVPDKEDGSSGFWYGIIGDTNPPDTRHWWYYLDQNPGKFVDHSSPIDPEEQIRMIQEHYHFLSQPSGRSALAENVNNLPKGYYERLAVGKSPDWTKVYIEGEYGFVIDGRPVFPEYRDSTHCSQNIRPQKSLPILRGWDFGLCPACTFTQVTSRGQVLVFDELVSDSMGVDRFGDTVVEYSKITYPGFEFQDFGDPAGAQRAQTDEKTCFQILEGKGILVTPGRIDLTSRLESVRYALNRMVDGRPGFQLHPRCEVLRAGFQGGYQYRKMNISGGDKFMEKPDKNSYSHVSDGLQMTLSAIFGDQIIDPNDINRGADDEGFQEYAHAAQRGTGRSTVTGY